MEVRFTGAILALIARLLSGASVRWIDSQPDTCQRVYFANHTSHLDAIVIWLALCHSEASRGIGLIAFMAGLAAGLASSGTLLSFQFLLMGGAMIAVARNWRTALVSAPAYGAGALIGLLPHFVAKYRYSGSFQAVAQVVPWRRAVGKILSPTIDSALPAAFGWRAPIFPDTSDRVPWLTGFDLYVGIGILVLLAIFTLTSLWSFFRRWHDERWPRLDASLILIGISWLDLALFLFSLRASSHAYRYLFPVVWSFPFLLTHAYRRGRPWSRRILGSLAALLVAINLTATTAVMARWSQPGFTDSLKCYDMTPVFRYLEEHGINRCYGTYTEAYRITYESDERIVCCQPYNERFAGWRVPFKEIVDSATNVAFVLSDSYRFRPADFEKELAAMQVKCRKETCGHYEIYTDFEPPAFPPPGPEIPPSSLVVTASHCPDKAAALCDGQYLKRWKSRKNQEKGMWIEIRLPSARTVSELVLYYNEYQSDRARAMRLLAWDGQGWTPAKEHISRQLDAFEFINNHPVYQNARQTIRITPVRTDRLRLEIEEVEPNHDWTIGEICVFASD